MSYPRYFHNEPAQTLYWVPSAPHVETIKTGGWRIRQTTHVISAQNRKVSNEWERLTVDPRDVPFFKPQYSTQELALNAFDINRTWGSAHEIDEAEFLRLKSIYEAQAGGEQVRHPKQG